MIHRIVFFYSFYLQIYLNIVKYNYVGFVFIPSFSLKKKRIYIYYDHNVANNCYLFLNI